MTAADSYYLMGMAGIVCGALLWFAILINL